MQLSVRSRVRRRATAGLFVAVLITPALTGCGAQVTWVDPLPFVQLSVTADGDHIEVRGGLELVTPVGTFTLDREIFSHHWNETGREQPSDVYVLVVRHRLKDGGEVVDTVFDIRTQASTVTLVGDGTFSLTVGPRRALADISGGGVTHLNGYRLGEVPKDGPVNVLPATVVTQPGWTPPPGWEPPPVAPSPAPVQPPCCAPPTAVPSATAPSATAPSPTATTAVPTQAAAEEPTLLRHSQYLWVSEIAIDLHSTASDWGANSGDWGSEDGYHYSDSDMEWFYGAGGSSIRIDGWKNRALVPSGVPWTLDGCRSVWSQNPAPFSQFEEGMRFCAWLGGGIWVMVEVREISPPDGGTPAAALVEIAVWHP